jgi:hypothetical protein
MGNNVIPFRHRKGATDSEKAASRGSRIIVRVGRQRYAIDISCAATALAAETDPAAERQPRVLQVETKFLRLRQPATLGERLDGWRVCWLGGWDRGRLFYVVMVERAVLGPDHLPLD